MATWATGMFFLPQTIPAETVHPVHQSEWAPEENTPGVRILSVNPPEVHKVVRLTSINPTPREQARSKVHELLKAY